MPERAYGADAQKMTLLDTPPALPTEEVKRIERIKGELLYYAMGLYNTCLVALSTISTRNYPTE